MSAPATAQAAAIVRGLFQKYSIIDPNQARRLARELFTQTEFDEYEKAIEVLDGNGALG